MEILNFLSEGCGYKLINDSKNIKILNEIFLELLSLSFPESKVEIAKFKWKANQLWLTP